MTIKNDSREKNIVFNEKHQLKMKGVLKMNENLETMELTPYEEEAEEVMETDEHSGIGTGLAMIIGSGLTLAAIAGGKRLKKLWDKHKSDRKQSDETIESTDYEVMDVSEDEEETE